MADQENNIQAAAQPAEESSAELAAGEIQEVKQEQDIKPTSEEVQGSINTEKTAELAAGELQEEQQEQDIKPTSEVTTGDNENGTKTEKSSDGQQQEGEKEGEDSLAKAKYEGIGHVVSDILGISGQMTSGTPQDKSTPGNKLQDANENDPVVCKLVGKGAEKLEEMKASGLINANTFDDRTMEELCKLSEEVVLDALNRFCQADIRSIRNHNRYLSAIVKRIQAAQMSDAALEKVSLDQEVVDGIEKLIVDYEIEGDEFLERATKSLKAFPKDKALDIITKYREMDRSKIENNVGFLMGIIKRFRHYMRIEQSAFDFDETLGKLPENIRSLFESNIETGMLDKTKLSPTTLDQLSKLPPEDQSEATNRLFSSDLKKVHNLTGFFIGILRRYPRKERKLGGYPQHRHQSRGGGQSSGFRKRPRARSRSRSHGRNRRRRDDRYERHGYRRPHGMQRDFSHNAQRREPRYETYNNPAQYFQNQTAEVYNTNPDYGRRQYQGGYPRSDYGRSGRY